MSEYKKETDLILFEDELIVKERYAFKIKTTGRQEVTLQYPLKIKNATARDKFGKLQVKLLSPHKLVLLINRKVPPGAVHAIELKLLVYKIFETIGGIQIIEWGSLDLNMIQSKIRPFQVIGFLRSYRKQNIWTYEENISRNINPNMARFRASRIELGRQLEIIVTLKFIIDTRTGGRITEFTFFGPKPSKRQKVELLTSGVEIKKDKNGNPMYSLDLSNSINTYEEREIHWRVIIPKGLYITSDLGSMKALKVLTAQNQQFRELLQADKYWEVNHPDIQKISNTLATKSTILDNHRYLFEYVNRRLKYTITNNRQSAVTALISKYGDCSEFADLLVTLHRAAGIPSRVVEGMILENSKKVNPEMHAWVEFLTTKGWMPCDPTWGIALGITSQHIEFNHQQEADLSTVFSFMFTGQRPVIKFQLSWK